MNRHNPIDLELLLGYRDHMSPEELERFGDYLSHRQPEHPFNWEEVEELERKRNIAERQTAPPSSDKS